MLQHTGKPVLMFNHNARNEPGSTRFAREITDIIDLKGFDGQLISVGTALRTAPLPC